jgi:hypothetical protein
VVLSPALPQLLKMQGTAEEAARQHMECRVVAAARRPMSLAGLKTGTTQQQPGSSSSTRSKGSLKTTG